ncbi:hypothetical protein CO046_02800, partial [Candidatus Peregrinibacteria bacterium CG_4_9_14_0_2_um_filter_53_11]
MMKHYQHFKKQLTASHSIHPLKRFLMWLVVLTLAGGLVSLFILTITIGIFSIGLPDVTQFDKLAGVESTVILDREEGILYTIHGEENRKYVPLSEISPHLQKATIAIEDDQFYTHSGFDISGIAAAGLHEVFGIGARRGGSTITQQLAKNAFLSSQRKITRKIKELILAIRLERAYDKNKILELYLNRIPYGNNAYGAEMAARLYFGKPARELTLPEAAVLASLPNGPTLYSPYGPYLYSSLDHELDGPVKLTDLTSDDYTTGLIGKEIVFSPDEKIYLPGRADLVLRRMAELKVITTAERDQAAEELHELEFSKHREAIRAAHFVFEIRRELEEKFGKEVVAQGGLQVLTTLDPTLQEVAEQAVADQIEANRESKGVTTGAVLTVDTQTGEILAMVGAADYFDEEAHGNVNHVYARRQPGSSFKPIIYAKAFVERYAPATVIYDTPTDFGNYRPQNYDGKFPGPMTIRRALGQSRNIPAIKAYFLAGQQEQIVPFAKSLGITSLSDTGDYGPALALGAGETTLSEMVQAFSVFATEGV